ncbi:MAG: hypothetical protein JST32_20745, partial [Bacteroidetes bacterium]|nr:hypothetical protein [Bacteroidota bacterium]
MIIENDSRYGKSSSERRNLAAGTNPFAGLGKLPPQAVDLEEAVLGALMLEKDA